jgi:hypothetical protein
MRPQFLDDAGNFMTEYRRRRKTVSTLDDLQVRVAHSTRRDFDQDIFLTYIRYEQIFDFQRLSSLVQHGCFHEFPFIVPGERNGQTQGCLYAKLITPAHGNRQGNRVIA